MQKEHGRVGLTPDGESIRDVFFSSSFLETEELLEFSAQDRLRDQQRDLGTISQGQTTEGRTRNTSSDQEGREMEHGSLETRHFRVLFEVEVDVSNTELPDVSLAMLLSGTPHLFHSPRIIDLHVVDDSIDQDVKVGRESVLDGGVEVLRRICGRSIADDVGQRSDRLFPLKIRVLVLSLSISHGPLINVIDEAQVLFGEGLRQ